MKRILAQLGLFGQFLMGFIFLISIQSDIQFGFAALLISQFMVNWYFFSKLEK